jgi:hypothetical protein
LQTSEVSAARTAIQKAIAAGKDPKTALNAESVQTLVGKVFRDVAKDFSPAANVLSVDKNECSLASWGSLLALAGADNRLVKVTSQGARLHYTAVSPNFDAARLKAELERNGRTTVEQIRQRAGVAATPRS